MNGQGDFRSPPFQEPTTEPPEPERSSFGYESVPASAKAPLVRGVFDSVAPRYDLMNDLMSLGIHRWWKSVMIDVLAPRAPMTLLDVAGGTGDIAMRFLDRIGDRDEPDAVPARAIVCDINAEMVAVGRDRAIDRNLLTGIDWVCGDAEALPFPSRSVDACTIAFGLRNVTRIDRALAEMRRVLRPGGRFLCLEFSRVALPLLDRLYDTYSFRVLPTLGEWVAGDRQAYQYLVESIRRFPAQEEVCERMQAAGFERVSYRNLSGGVVALHSGWRL